MSIDPHFITAFLYLIAAILAWMPRRAVAGAAGGTGGAGGVGEGGPQEGGTISGVRANAIQYFLIGGIVFQGITVFRDLFSSGGFNLSFAVALSLIFFCTLVVYLFIGFGISRLDLVARYLAPAAIVVAVLPALMPAQYLIPYGDQTLFKFHFVVAILGYVLFTVAALHALLMAAMENWLHHGDLPQEVRGLPPLIRMEVWLFRLLLAAFVLLTLTLVSGVFFSEAMFGKPFQFNHKTVFAFISWVIFAGLLFGHWRYGWRGKKAVRLTLAGFVALLLAYVGSKFVLQVLLGRI
jgi:ABC-type uncharacterized transport system permease subunit